RLQQYLARHGLEQKLERPGLHRADGGGHVVTSRYEYDGRDVVPAQPVLQLETADFGERQVEQQAGCLLEFAVFQKCRCGFERNDVYIGRLEQLADRLTDASVIVDQINDFMGEHIFTWGQNVYVACTNPIRGSP